MTQEQGLTAIDTITSYGKKTPNGHNLWWKQDESAIIMWKGVESEYKSTLELVKTIDLSSNHLTGGIPNEITSLVGLVSLNISRNFILDHSSTYGQLHLLDFLDLSRNKLSGVIPMSIAQLTYIGVLDLSYNIV
ncbi:hypothetical protein BUALT_Bualt03G0152600 [Buddleja alternifolia]|uniref:Uncharacterized protein n=1 Tax=Buddleja alternifolia TaxID=168488 RepID=A0AAV6Y0T1_9LAMI|nr:hypothetical protein BUALT_Bualt03G0152600 [Buddleja alternifolia]